MLCYHERSVRLSDGWFCPDRGQRFAEKSSRKQSPREKERVRAPRNRRRFYYTQIVLAADGKQKRQGSSSRCSPARSCNS